MALFLSEAVAGVEATQHETLFEAMATLLELSQEQAAMNEAVLTADYILEKQTQNLSEGETMDKIKSFAKRVWEGVKIIAAKVWAKIKDICRLVVRKLSIWFTKAASLFGEEREIQKSQLYTYENLPRVLERIIAFAENGWMTAAGSATPLAPLAQLQRDIEAFKAAKSKATGTEKVKVAVAEKFAKQLEALSGKLTAACDKQAAAFTKMENEGKSTDETKAAAQAGKAGVDALRRAAAELTAGVAAVPGASSGGGEAAEAAPKAKK